MLEEIRRFGRGWGLFACNYLVNLASEKSYYIPELGEICG